MSAGNKRKRYENPPLPGATVHRDESGPFKMTLIEQDGTDRIQRVIHNVPPHIGLPADLLVEFEKTVLKNGEAAGDMEHIPKFMRRVHGGFSLFRVIRNAYHCAVDTLAEHDQEGDPHSSKMEAVPQDKCPACIDARETIEKIKDALPHLENCSWAAVNAAMDLMIAGECAQRLPVWKNEHAHRAGKSSERGRNEQDRGRTEQNNELRKEEDPDVLSRATKWVSENPNASYTRAVKTLMALCGIGKPRLLEVARHVLPVPRPRRKKCTP